MEAKIYNSKGKEAGKIELPESVFSLPWNADLVHEVVTSLLSTSRTPVAHARTRGEVSGSNKKPWQQKGTGRARHGSRRSPIWVGGGVAHGPRNDKNYARKINKKVKAKALATVISAKLKDGEIIFVDSLSFAAPKTKEAKEILSNLSKAGFEALTSKKKNTAIFATAGKNKNAEKSFANLGNIGMVEVRNISPVDVLSAKYLIIENPEESIKVLSERVASKK